MFLCDIAYYCILLNVIVYFSNYCILFSVFVGYCILLHILEFSLYIIADYSILSYIIVYSCRKLSTIVYLLLHIIVFFVHYFILLYVLLYIFCIFLKNIV